MRSIKLYSDGALGSRGAALLEPYSDDPKTNGLLVSAPAHIQEVADAGAHDGLPGEHATPSATAATALVLDAYEARSRQRPTADHRFRIEHAQILHYRRHPALRRARA